MNEKMKILLIIAIMSSLIIWQIYFMIKTQFYEEYYYDYNGDNQNQTSTEIGQKSSNSSSKDDASTAGQKSQSIEGSTEYYKISDDDVADVENSDESTSFFDFDFIDGLLD
ncbi:uncharacterized protein [Rhodnius prolixus]|uniref:uncharacterized protein n=1 Tax=Rhodnius prolixus TaxID=13249 RepID=UPI003D18ACE6